jgi:hypothetical protein
MNRPTCPLFSKELELHILEVKKGNRPNIGTFCKHCFHPFKIKNNTQVTNCKQCKKEIKSNDITTEVPREICLMLLEVRKIERTYVISFAFLGIFLSLLTGFSFLGLNFQFFEKNEIIGIIILFAYILVTGRLLANFFGGIGDKIGYLKARNKLNEQWQQWIKKK